MLWTLVAIFLILWLLGFSMSIGGGLIHILLVVALILVARDRCASNSVCTNCQFSAVAWRRRNGHVYDYH